MKTLKMNSLTRLLAIVLIAVILISVITIAVGGKQSNYEDDNDSGDIGNTTEKTDEDKDSSTEEDQNNDQTQIPDDNTQEALKFFNPITGLEVTEDEYKSSPLAFLVDSNAPLYGISNADITFEIPLENGKTRLLVYQTKRNTLWKIGSLAPARDFISSLANLFGGTIISYEKDDIVDYDADDHSSTLLDLSYFSGSYNVENSKYVYSSLDRINEVISKNSDTSLSEYKSAPYFISDEAVFGTSEAKSIFLPYSEKSDSNLFYSERTGKYTYYKSSTKAIDKLSGAEISYKNVFVLFANSTTYETSVGKELIIDTYSGGSGYYASNGQMTEINWNLTEDGTVIFTTLNGEILKVNKGNSYIAFYKTSISSDVLVK